MSYVEQFYEFVYYYEPLAEVCEDCTSDNLFYTFWATIDQRSHGFVKYILFS